MTKPIIRIRFVQGRYFYHLRNGLVRERLMKFNGGFDIDQLYKDMQRDKIVFSENTIQEDVFKSINDI